MTTTILTLNRPSVKLATTEAGLTAGTAVECQINSAIFTATATYSTVPSTGCQGPQQNAGLTSWTFDVTFLQDWPAAEATALSWFASANDGKDVWVLYTPDQDIPGLTATAEVTAHAGNFGGTFGDGSAADASLSWPVKGSPTFASGGVMADEEAA